MTSNYSAVIQINAKEKTKAIFDSLNTDNQYYPENPAKTTITLDEIITIRITANHLPHLRANLNSCIRLVQASYDSIESVNI